MGLTRMSPSYARREPRNYHGLPQMKTRERGAIFPCWTRYRSTRNREASLGRPFSAPVKKFLRQALPAYPTCQKLRGGETEHLSTRNTNGKCCMWKMLYGTRNLQEMPKANVPYNA